MLTFPTCAHEEAGSYCSLPIKFILLNATYMKMELCLLVVVFSLLSVRESSAQLENQIIFNDADNISKISKGGGGYFASMPIYDGVSGSPLLFEGTQATVFREGRPLKGTYSLIFDASRNLFLLKSSANYFELNPMKIDSILIGDKHFEFIKGVYFELVFKGEVSLLKKYEARVEKPSYVPALNTGSKESSWKMTENYFLLVTNEVREISPNKRALKKALYDQRELLGYLESSDQKINSYQDMVTLLTLFYSRP